MRRAARIDDNQIEIVNGLRKFGCSVLVLSMIGKGCPDILVGYLGANYLIEIKDGNKIPSKRKLTPDEIEFISNWRGDVIVTESLQYALDILSGKK